MEREEIELAMIDESADYEIDQAYVLYLPATKKFVLKTASGCSCWGGEYDYTEFDSLKDMESVLLMTETRYNPSLNGAKQLMDEAHKKYESLGFKPSERDNRLSVWLNK